MKLSNLPFMKTVIGNMIKREFQGFTLFVTSVCNLRCKYCFNLDNLGKGTDDLTFEEINQLADHLPPMNGIIYSGGEPLLREEIVEISEMFIKKNKVKGFGIPSNCVDGENTLSKVKRILALQPGANVVVCCGLDVYSDNHNDLRGRGTYDKVCDTLKELVKLRNTTPGLSVLVNSVVGKSSIPQLLEFVRFVRTFNPDLHTIEVVRDDTNKFQNLGAEDFETVKSARLLIDKLYRENDLMFKLYRVRSKVLTDIQKSVLLEDGKWPVACLAGKTSFIVQSNGDVSICESQAPLGNLRRDGFDPIHIIKSRGEEQFRAVRQHACDCSHFLNLKETLEHNFPVVLMQHLYAQGLGKELSGVFGGKPARPNVLRS